MGQELMEPGGLHKREMGALKDSMRLEILHFIGDEIKRLDEIGRGMGLSEAEAKDQVALLQDALLVEIEGELCSLTPRCIAYIDQARGYEWKR